MCVGNSFSKNIGMTVTTPRLPCRGVIITGGGKLPTDPNGDPNVGTPGCSIFLSEVCFVITITQQLATKNNAEVVSSKNVVN